MGALFSQKIALRISAKRPEQGTKPSTKKEGYMDWVKVLFTVVEKAASIVIEAMNSGNIRR